MTPALVEQILEHAKSDSTRECCGILIWDGKHGAIYRPCRNIADDGESNFHIHPEDWISAEDAGTILGVVHSHPDEADPVASEQDRSACDRSGVPWWVFTLDGAWSRIVPGTWTLTGHPFAWGVQDCFTLLRDFYRGVPDLVREPAFWLNTDLISKNIMESGFHTVDSVEIHDTLIMSIRSYGVPNHCAVYIGDGRIVHHMPGRLSREEQLGPINRAVVAVARRTV